MAGSRYDQLAKLAAEAKVARDALASVLEQMEEVREGVQEWYDAMNENWQQGEAGQKAETVGGLDLSPDSLLSEVFTVYVSCGEALRAAQGGR
jgi:hypothetical protein